MVTRYGRSLCHGEACGNGILRAHRHRHQRSCDRLCRQGCGVEKTLDHFLFDCPTYDRDRAGFHKVCSILGIEFDIQTIFTRKELLPLVEKLFLSIADN